MVVFYLPACDAVWLYLLQEYAELAFVLAAKSDHAESQAGAFRLIQLKKIVALPQSMELNWNKIFSAIFSEYKN